MFQPPFITQLSLAFNTPMSTQVPLLSSSCLVSPKYFVFFPPWRVFQYQEFQSLSRSKASQNGYIHIQQPPALRIFFLANFTIWPTILALKHSKRLRRTSAVHRFACIHRCDVVVGGYLAVDRYSRTATGSNDDRYDYGLFPFFAASSGQASVKAMISDSSRRLAVFAEKNCRAHGTILLPDRL